MNERKNKAHLKFLHELPCCISGTWGDDVIAHHLLSAGGRGMGMKAEDSKTVPMLASLHVQLHEVDKIVAKTEQQWFAKKGVGNVQQLAWRLWVNTGDHEMAESAIRIHWTRLRG